MSMEAKQTPLIELPERVPQDARVVVEHDQFSSSSHPVGRLCHEAAAELRRLHAEVERLRGALAHPAITHCDTCGCDWLDNGLNPVGCPYCKQTASVEEMKAPDLWRCTVCGRVGTVGRCCGEETREPVNHAVLSEENSND